MSRKSLGLVARFGVVALCYGVSPASAQTAPSLGAAQGFAVLGGSTVTNTGPTVVTNDLGLQPGTSVTGFPPGRVVSGTIHIADDAALQAQNSVTLAYDNLGTQACQQDLSGQDLGGKTLTPGIYCFSTSAQLTGILQLNGLGNPNAVFIFKMGSTLTTASNASVVLQNSASACNVFWRVGSSATLGTSTSFAGNILALASITANTSANLSGRALARNGAVTLDSNAINAAVCGAGTTPPPAPPPTPVPVPVPTPICATTRPELFIVKRHTEQFVAGTNGAYSIALFNAGFTSSGAITVTDTLPTGLTFVSATGSTWSCAAAGQIVTCTTSAVVASAGPFPNNITLTVTPGANAVPGVINTAAVTGGNDCDTTNNATSDVTLVSPAVPVPVPPVPVPTLSQWAFTMLALLLAAIGFMALRRRTS